MFQLNILRVITPQMSSYPSEAEVYRYVVCYNRALIQEYARLSLAATAAAQRDECGGGEREDNEIEMVPISLNIWWGKLKESSFKLDMLQQAVEQGYELILGCSFLEHTHTPQRICLTPCPP